MDHVNGTSPSALRSAVAELDRQVERGSLFTQAALQRSVARLSDAEELLTRLVGALAARGLVAPEELGLSMRVVEEVEETEDVEDVEPPAPSEEVPPSERREPTITWPAIALRVDDDTEPARPEIEVDCAARMHVCRAVCCQLKFPLSPAEVEAGTLKWDIGHPYIIRQESSGYCSHNDTSNGCCTVYADRPKVCRRYSCANDPRIWSDFDGMVLNQEWIDAHLGRRDLHVDAVVPSMDVPVELTRKPAGRP